MNEAKTDPAAAPPPEPVWVCAVCGGADVQHAMWVSLNTNAIHEAFGGWCYGDNNYCPNCDDHTEIIEKVEYDKRQLEKHELCCDLDEDCTREDLARNAAAFKAGR